MPPTTASPSAPLIARATPLRTSGENLPVGSLHFGRDGVVTFESPRATDITGRSWLGAPYAAIELLRPLHEAIETLLANGTPFERSETMGADATGLAVRLRALGTPLHDAEGTLVGGALTLLDVTAEHEQTAALQLRARYDAAEPALRALALTSPDGLSFLERTVSLLAQTAGADRARVLLAADGDTLVPVALWCRRPSDTPEPVEVDPSHWPILHGGEPALLGDGHADRALLADAGCTSAVLAPFRDAHEGEPPTTTARIGLFLFERLLGSAPWTAAEARALGRLSGVFEVLWAWMAAEARYQQTIADLDDGLFSFSYDAHGQRQYAFVTDRFDALVGTTDGEPWTSRIHKKDREAFEAHEGLLRTGERSRFTFRLRQPDGTVCWLRESATPSRSPSGRPIVGGLLSDVTEQKRAEATLVQAKQSAEQASDAKTAFLSTMSHELRSPLGAVRGFAELLAEEVREAGDQGVALPPAVGEFAGVILENASRALRLIHDLFDLTRLETGALALQRIPVALHPIVGHVLDRHRPDAEAKGLTIETDLADSDLVVNGDPDRIAEVVEHLISNAVKFTEAGTVTVRTRREGRHAQFIAEDTGIGIAEAYLDRLFEPFTQEDDGLTRSFSGSGLGLAIAKRLVDGMGGAIQVTSEKGVGSTFEVTLGSALDGAA